MDDTKRWGMLNLVNQLFKIYFRVNKLHLCKPLIRAIESLPFKNEFSLSQLVTYRYYTGRKAMFDCDYKAGQCQAVSHGWAGETATRAAGGNRTGLGVGILLFILAICQRRVLCE